MSAGAARCLSVLGLLFLVATLQGEPSAEQIRQLIQQLGDDRFRLREQATRELIEIGRPALALVREAMDHRDAEIANRAQRIVAEIQSSLEYLLAILKEGDAKLRMEAAIGLERLGPAGKDAMPVLLAALQDDNNEVREAVVSAILAIDPFQPAIEDYVPARAHVQGKYAKLARRLKAPQDRQSYSDFRDYGFYQACDWNGYTNIPAGYWVYVYPYWYVWREQANKGN
jgi:HEAT repeat protein